MKSAVVMFPNWPALAESGAGTCDDELIDLADFSAPVERSAPGPLDLGNEVRRHPGLAIGLSVALGVGLGYLLGQVRSHPSR